MADVPPPSGSPGRELSFEDLARVLDALPEAVMMARVSDAMISYTNAAADAQLGFERGALLGRHSLDLAHTDPMAIEDLVDSLNADESQRGHFGALRRADGGIMRTIYSSAAVDIQGEIHGVSIILDPDRLKGELLQAARDASARMHSMMDEAPVTVSIKDLASRYVFVNRRFLDDTGRETAEILGRTTQELVGDAGIAVDEAEARVVESGEPMVLEASMPHRDGTDHAFLFSKFPLWGRHDTIVGICTMGIDVSGERRAQDALAESDGRLRELAESVDDAFILMYTDPFEIVYHSPNLDSVTGRRVGEMTDDPLEFLNWAHPDDRDRARRDLGLLAARPGSRAGTVTAELRILGHDDVYRWLRVRSRRLADDRTGRMRVGTIIADITADREIEAELERARVQAEQANLRKNEFLSSMSHELRTPLNAILGFSQLLEMDHLTLNAQQREAVGHIRRAGDHLLELINEVLDIARIESGELRLSFESIDVGPVVAEAIELIRSMADERRIDISIAPPGQGPMGVKADRQRLRQVLINLVSNAIKYNQIGGHVSVSWRRGDDDRVEIEVRDTGSGIPPEDIDRLFLPFERLENSTGIEGTGIGLTLTRQLVEAMGGAIAVESEPGRGSTFTVELHSAEPGLATDPAGRSALGGRTAAADAEVGERVWTVLYVEDNAANIELVERTLARLPSVRTRVALRGDEALDLLAREPVDLLLLDLHLPDMLGDALLAEVRADPVLAELPVLVISADATPARINRLLAAGAAGYLTKPFELRRLLDLVRSLLPELAEAPAD